jgi:hypothetical protein
MLSNNGLTQEQLQDVLARAEEIQRAEATNSYASVVAAAEEAGLSKDAVGRALQERLGLLGAPPESGELVFARGPQDRFFAAEVLERREHAYRVKLLNGGEQTVRFEDLRPMNLLPGEKVVCPWPDWGWWTCTVLRFDLDRRKLRVTDNWGSEKVFDLAEVYKAEQKPGIRDKAKWLLFSAIGLGGGIVGSLLTWLAMR